MPRMIIPGFALRHARSVASCVRGVLLAKGPDFSFGGVPVGLASMTSTWKKKGYKSRFRQKKKRKEKHTGGNKVRKRERANNHSSA